MSSKPSGEDQQHNRKSLWHQKRSSWQGVSSQPTQKSDHQEQQRNSSPEGKTGNGIPPKGGNATPQGNKASLEIVVISRTLQTPEEISIALSEKTQTGKLQQWKPWPHTQWSKKCQLSGNPSMHSSWKTIVTCQTQKKRPTNQSKHHGQSPCCNR